MDNNRVKMRIYYPDGKKLKLALTLEPSAPLHLNSSEIGIDTGCLLEFKGGAVRIRSESGEVFSFRGLTGSDFAVRVGDAWTRGNCKVEFLILPEAPPEDDATRYMSFSKAMAATAKPEEKPEEKKNKLPDDKQPVIRKQEEIVVQEDIELKDAVAQQEAPLILETPGALAVSEEVELTSPERQHRSFHKKDQDVTGQILRMQVPEQPVAPVPVSRASQNTTDIRGAVPPEIQRARKIREGLLSFGMVLVGVEVIFGLTSIGREQRLIPLGVSGTIAVAVTWFVQQVFSFFAKDPKYAVAGMITLRHTAWGILALSAASAGTLSLVMKISKVDLSVNETPVVTEAVAPAAIPSPEVSLAPRADGVQDPNSAPAVVTAAQTNAEPVSVQTAAAVAPTPVVDTAFPDHKEEVPSLEAASLSRDAFFSAVRSGDLSLVRSLVEKRVVDVNYTLDKGTPALHIACAHGRIPVIKYLISKRANINARDSSGATALHWAVFKRQRPVALGLVRHGSDLNAKTESGDRPVDIAKRYGLSNYIDWLQPKDKKKTASKAGRQPSKVSKKAKPRKRSKSNPF